MPIYTCYLSIGRCKVRAKAQVRADGVQATKANGRGRGKGKAGFTNKTPHLTRLVCSPKHKTQDDL